MKKKKRYYMNLQESVMLDEFNVTTGQKNIIIMVVFLMVLFIIWSNFLIIEDTVSLEGYVWTTEDSYQVMGYARASDIMFMEQGTPVYLSFAGSAGIKRIDGQVISIDRTPHILEDGNIFYQVIIHPMSEVDGYRLLNGMEVGIRVKTGERTLMQYILGYLYEATR